MPQEPRTSHKEVVSGHLDNGENTSQETEDLSMVNRPISPFAFKWESHADGPGGSSYTGIWHEQLLSQSSGKLALSHSKGRADASSYQKLLV